MGFTPVAQAVQVTDYERKIAELERKRGQLTMEVDLRKKGRSLGRQPNEEAVPAVRVHLSSANEARRTGVCSGCCGRSGRLPKSALSRGQGRKQFFSLRNFLCSFLVDRVKTGSKSEN